jgi:hypothetical protein
MGSLAIEIELQQRGPAAAIVLDEQQIQTLGEGRKRFPVVATVNGYRWRTSVFSMKGEYLIGLSKEVRAGAGAEAGDTVAVELALDTQERTVDVGPALTAALDGDPAARAAFDALAFTHRKEFARWVQEAKRDETRERRVERTLEMLRAGQNLS